VLQVTGVAYDADRTCIDSYTPTIITGYGIGLHLPRVTPE